MTAPKTPPPRAATIGEQLDALGMDCDLEPGHRVLEATVTLVTGDGERGRWHREPIILPKREPGATPVPHPVECRIITVVEDHQEISEEQRARVATWLEANGIDPSRVALGRITVESKLYAGKPGWQIIGFTEYYETPDGHRVVDQRNRKGALTYQRWVEQSVPLEPDPAWEGWDARRAQTPPARPAGAEATG